MLFPIRLGGSFVQGIRLSLRHLLLLGLFVLLELSSGGAWANRICAEVWSSPDPIQEIRQFTRPELYPRVLSLLNRKIAPTDKSRLQKLWQQIDSRQPGRLWEQILAQAAQSYRGKSAFIEYQKLRFSPSNSTSRSISAEQAWLAADELMRSWVSNNEAFSLEKIFELNAALDTDNQSRMNPLAFFNPFILLHPTLGQIQGSAGRIRTTDLHDSNTPNSSYPDFNDIPKALDDFMIWYQKNESRLHPIQLAAQAYQRLVSIHPFTNGNGRTSRMVMDWILLRNGYIPPIFPGVDQRNPVRTRAAIFGQWSDHENLPPEQVIVEMTKGIFLGIDFLEQNLNTRP